MFEANQSIMLMGAAGSTDVSLHLSNAANSANSDSQKEVAESSVNFIDLYFYVKMFLFSGFFRDRIKKLREHLLREFNIASFIWT